MPPALPWRGPEMSTESLVEQMDDLLHALCQPLTVLQCRLALGELSGEPSAMRAAIGEALGECMRVNKGVSAIREMLQAAEAQGR